MVISDALEFYGCRPGLVQVDLNKFALVIEEDALIADPNGVGERILATPAEEITRLQLGGQKAKPDLILGWGDPDAKGDLAVFGSASSLFASRVVRSHHPSNDDGECSPKDRPPVGPVHHGGGHTYSTGARKVSSGVLQKHTMKKSAARRQTERDARPVSFADMGANPA